jgi:hypothetical protein
MVTRVMIGVVLIWDKHGRQFFDAEFILVEIPAFVFISSVGNQIFITMFLIQ